MKRPGGDAPSQGKVLRCFAVEEAAAERSKERSAFVLEAAPREKRSVSLGTAKTLIWQSTQRENRTGYESQRHQNKEKSLSCEDHGNQKSD